MANNVAATAGTGTTFKTTDNAGVHTGHINVDACALPTGAATAANQQTDALTDTQLRATAVPVSGTITANAGTNLNTSALATETTLAAQAANVAIIAATSTPYQNLDVDESEDEVKGTAGKVYFIHAINLKATKLYLKFYNATAANVTVGSTTPVLTFPVPTLGDTNGMGFTVSIPGGLNFSTAITIAATTGFAVADTGAPGANEMIVNLGYA